MRAAKKYVRVPKGRLYKKVTLSPATKELLEKAAVRLSTSESNLVEAAILRDPRINNETKS
jgi:hypothetical protein